MNARPATAIRPCLPPWLAVVLLGVFLAVRGLVPAGFMPTAVASGGPYQLCHGDSRSALLLSLAVPARSSDRAHGGHGHEHGHAQAPQASQHQHDDATAQVFSDNHCNFSSAGASIATRADLPWSPLPGFAAPAPAAPVARSHDNDYLFPPGRAPPIASILA
ncbi:hypothetical protein [Microbulbifer pacificus]|uniref:DUF2946 domain-containing protein n=1 Tax=Microbulbifer pacificus TaxID=407164 RepID=A0AAU0MXJ5_9GAMM|nr:hypothetical protein [Microbulbifer pacificus]WOX04188.1 hypothetical protein R5R33_10570 [Microbulbifer pacificus]